MLIELSHSEIKLPCQIALCKTKPEDDVNGGRKIP